MSTGSTEGVVGRLAPTPSGLLHLGNALAFGAAWLSAKSQGGRVLLRIEDVDRARARRHIEDEQKRDLEWLGLEWDEETRRQSEREYEPWLDRIREHTYGCHCSRAVVRAAGGVYPGTCRDQGFSDGRIRFRLPDTEIRFHDRRFGETAVRFKDLGDPVVYRHDHFFTYPLAVVADDITDGVTEVVRGADLLPFTAIQLHLFDVLGAPPPTYLHAPIVLGEDGKKLSKSHGSSHIGAMREAGWTSDQVWRLVLPWLGLDATPLKDAVASFEALGPKGSITIEPGALHPV